MDLTWPAANSNDAIVSLPPVATLRAHPAPITSIAFLPCFVGASPPTAFVVSGDEAGYVYVWNVATRRPVSVFRPHSKALVKVDFVCMEKDGGNVRQVYLITHGRDNAIHIFDALPVIEKALQRADSDDDMLLKLPTLGDQETVAYNAPETVYTLPVNALNFCGFAATLNGTDTLILAVPSTMASENIDVYSIALSAPFSLTRVCAGIPGPAVNPTTAKKTGKKADTGFGQVGGGFGPPGADFADYGEDDGSESSARQNGTGIVMSLCLVPSPSPQRLYLITGYESGHVAQFDISLAAGASPTSAHTLLHVSKLHAQPVLSLAHRPPLEPGAAAAIYSSAADSRIVRSPVPPASPSTQETPFDSTDAARVYKLSAPGTADLAVRDDHKLVASAGWDGLVRVFSFHKSKVFKPLASFRGGRQNGGISSVSFGPTVSATVESKALASPSSLMQKLARSHDKGLAHYLAVAGKDGRIGIYTIY